MKRFFFLLLAILLSLCGSIAQNAIAPLFPVAINHDFSNPDKTFNDVRELILNNYYSADVTELTQGRKGVAWFQQHLQYQ